jgi:hypothetical protein
MSSRSDGVRRRAGIGRGRRARLVFVSVRRRRLFAFIAGLLSQCNQLLIVSELHLEPVAVRGDGHVAVSEATDEVEGLAWRLLPRQAHLVVSDPLLDGVAHVGGCTEESVCRHEPVERLVRALEVIRVDEMHDATVAICEVRKHRA